jgi:Holliday junction DNA helicase RuvA
VIGRLRGKLLEKEPTGIVVEAGGVGYSVAVPLSTFSRLDGEDVDLFVHTEVRADAILLFGFLHREERDAFRKLITIQGVGPQTALAVLSGMSLQELIAAVEGGDIRRLCGIPRVGKKTAERICLELKGKVEELAASGLVASSPDALPAELGDALTALENLGYKSAFARRALRQAREEQPDGSLETWIRRALKILSG